MAGILDPRLMGPAQTMQQPAGLMAQQPQTQPQPGGMMGGFRSMMNPATMLPIAGQLLGSGGNMANFGNAMMVAGQGMQQRQQQKKTLEYLWRTDPELAEMVEATGMPLKDAWEIRHQRLKAQMPESTSGMKEYNFARSQGYQGSFLDFQLDQKKAGATNVTIGGGKYGTIPQGYELVEGEQGATMRPIPGGPADTTRNDQVAQGQADVATRVVTSAAQRARDAAANRNFGHVGQGIVQHMPWTDSAEVARQVEVLKSTAKIENLQAMRAASPTGGALGNVSNTENEMLAAKSGALDPSSPTFLRDLEDYELTLLQVVHGPEEGARIFRETRQAGGGNRTQTGAPQRLRYNPATGQLE